MVGGVAVAAAVAVWDMFNEDDAVFASEFIEPNMDDVEAPNALNRCDGFGNIGDGSLCRLNADGVLRFDVLAEVFEFLQIGGGFEWSKSK